MRLVLTKLLGKEIREIVEQGGGKFLKGKGEGN